MENELCGVCFWNLCFTGYGRDYDVERQKNGTTFRDLVGKTFVGSSGVLYQYEQPPISSKEDYQRFIVNPKYNLEGVVYYPNKKNAEAAVASLNGSIVNGQPLSVALQNK